MAGQDYFKMLNLKLIYSKWLSAKNQKLIPGHTTVRGFQRRTTS